MLLISELKHALFKGFAISHYMRLLRISRLLMKSERELLSHVNEEEPEETRRVKHVEGDVERPA